MRVIDNKPVVKRPTNNEKITSASPILDIPVAGLTTYFMNSVHTNTCWSIGRCE
jgi:hypothetical protein